MGVEDAVTALLGKSGGSKQILEMVTGLVGGGGGLSALVEQFTKAGHGAKAASWVGTGPNEELTGEEVVKALGPEKVDEAARKAGLSHDEAANELAGAIPKVVNELTPEGKVPEREMLDELVGKLKGLLG